jgi:hypothetical protein
MQCNAMKTGSVQAIVQDKDFPIITSSTILLCLPKKLLGSGIGLPLGAYESSYM